MIAERLHEGRDRDAASSGADFQPTRAARGAGPARLDLGRKPALDHRPKTETVGSERVEAAAGIQKMPHFPIGGRREVAMRGPGRLHVGPWTRKRMPLGADKHALLVESAAMNRRGADHLNGVRASIVANVSTALRRSTAESDRRSIVPSSTLDAGSSTCVGLPSTFG